MDRLRALSGRLAEARLGFLFALAPAIVFLGACEERETAPRSSAGSSRFAAVKNERAQEATTSFCEKSYPAQGSDARRFVTPPDRPMPRAKERSTEVDPPKVGAGWRWINLWASWCGPCLKEMPLLGTWRSSLEKEGLPVRFELWSVDSDEGDLERALDRTFPGEVRWLRSEGDLPVLLESLGVEKSSAIPIHALVDPSGMLRCVRVGSVGEGVYGSVKAILAGG